MSIANALVPSVAFPGITPADVVSFSGTVGVDNTPGRFTIGVVGTAPVATDGDLVVGDGERSFTAPACRRVDARWAGGVYQVILEDRRWRWRTGVVTGRYNVPEETFDGFRYEKTPRELAAILWAEMNETSLDVSLLPNDARPTVDWRSDNAARALIALIGQLGCVLAPQLDGTWAVYPVGSGAVYADETKRVSSNVTQTFALYPDQVAVVTDAIQYEAVFALEAVGEDTDGRIRPIDDLSYAPAAGWNTEGPRLDGIDGTYVRDGRTLNNVDLARSCVRRWYRIASMPAGGGTASLEPPGYDSENLGGITELDQLLPLAPVINEIEETEGSINFGKRLPAEVWGVYQPDEELPNNTRPGSKVREPFSIDTERGIVKFSRPITRINESVGAFATEPGDLLLRCVVEARQPDNNQPAFYARTQSTGLNNGTGAESIARDDLALRYTPSWNADGTAVEPEEGEDHPSNLVELNAELDHVLTAKLAGYAPRTGGTMQFAGIHVPQLNGRQTSVSWNWSTSTPARTTVGVSARANPYSRPFEANQREVLSNAEQRQRDRRAILRARGQHVPG